MRAALRRGTYDLWHTGHFPAPRATRLPFTCLIHDLRNLSTLVTPLKRALAKQTLKSAFRRAAHVVTVSEAMRVELHHHFPRLKVTAIPHGADHLPVLARGPAPYAPILFFGHLEKRRNPELLLHALAADASLPNVRFAGAAKGDQAERLDALAHKLGVANRIQITGPVAEADLPALLAAAACLVLPSRIEGFGLPAIEALRAGLPLAIADSPALREATPASTPVLFRRRPARLCLRDPRRLTSRRRHHQSRPNLRGTLQLEPQRHPLDRTLAILAHLTQPQAHAPRGSMAWSCRRANRSPPALDLKTFQMASGPCERGWMDARSIWAR